MELSEKIPGIQLGTHAASGLSAETTYAKNGMLTESQARTYDL
jgi:hypothetical protein